MWKYVSAVIVFLSGFGVVIIYLQTFTITFFLKSSGSEKVFDVSFWSNHYEERFAYVIVQNPLSFASCNTDEKWIGLVIEKKQRANFIFGHFKIFIQTVWNLFVENF